MAIQRIEAKDCFPTELMRALEYIVEDIQDNDEADDSIHQDCLATGKCIKEALSDYGYCITYGQGVQVYSNYSFNKWASWLVGEPTTIEDAKLTIIDFAKDVLFGENHIGYGN